MKAEISNHGFEQDERASGVYLQQGRMITDRDWNALCDVLSARLAETGRLAFDDGSPRAGGLLTGFVESGGAWRARLRPAGGRLAAEGRIGTVAPLTAELPLSWSNQRDLPGFLETPPKVPEFLYVDVWDQVQTAFALPDLLDPALHGADTAFVTRRIAQMKAATGDMLEETDCGLRLDPLKAPRIGTGLAAVALREAAEGGDPCDPCAETVDVEAAVGNHLWRLEVHAVRHDEGGAARQVHLKWSEENGATQWRRPAGFDHAALDPGYAYEFFNDATELEMGLPPEGYGTQPDRGEIRHQDHADAPARYDRVRRWDGWCAVDVENGAILDGWDRGRDLSASVASGHGRAVWEDGVAILQLERLTVRLDLGNRDPDGEPRRAIVGDHWLALARSRAPEGSKIRLLSTTPVGIRHGYAPLGAPDESGARIERISPADKRRLSFPSLDCLRAEDVAYDPSDCAWAGENAATDVQAALDAFCQRLQHPYVVLRASSGTGQEGPANAFLTCPVGVVAEDQDGRPVKAARVTFDVPAPGGDGVSLDDSGGAPATTSVIAQTDETGHAWCWWWLGSGGGVGPFPDLPGREPPGRARDGETRAPAPACHSLRARLTDAPPQGTAPPVRFTARAETKGPGGGPVEAGDVSYDPECGYLRERKVDDVAGALEALCAAIPRSGDLPRVEGMSWPNDRPLQVEAFVAGVELALDREIATGSMSADTVILTVEALSLDARGSRTAPPGPSFQSIILAVEIEKIGPRKVMIVPRTASVEDLAKWLREQAAMLSEMGLPPRLRVRLRIMGRATFGPGGEPLDGFVPGAPRDDGSAALDFGAAGLGHASDFEAWFHLVAG